MFVQSISYLTPVDNKKIEEISNFAKIMSQIIAISVMKNAGLNIKIRIGKLLK